MCDQIEVSASLHEGQPRELHRYIEIVCDTILANNINISDLRLGELSTRLFYGKKSETPEIPVTNSLPLPLAAALGWKTYVSNLIADGEDVNRLHPVFGHSLNSAAYQGHVTMIQLLLDNKVRWFQPPTWTCSNLVRRINRQDPVGFSPLSLAASAGHLDAVQLLLHLDLFTAIGRGWSDCSGPVEGYQMHCELAMMHAIRNNQGNVFDFLSPQTRLRNLTRYTPAMVWLECIKVAASCVDVKFMDRFAQMLKSNFGLHKDSMCMSFSFTSCYSCQTQATALTSAAQSGRVDILQLLVDRGFNIDAFEPNIYGRALDRVSDLDTLKCLHRLGSDFSLHAYPLEYLGGPDINLKRFIHFGKQDMFDYFLANAVDIDSKWLGSALEFAASRGNLRCVKALIEKGANPRGVPLNTYRFQHSISPTMAAVQSSHWEVVDYLRSCGVGDLERPPALCWCINLGDPCYRDSPSTIPMPQSCQRRG